MKIIYLVLDAVSYEYSWLKNDLMKNLNQIKKKSLNFHKHYSMTNNTGGNLACLFSGLSSTLNGVMSTKENYNNNKYGYLQSILKKNNIPCYFYSTANITKFYDAKDNIFFDKLISYGPSLASHRISAEKINPVYINHVKKLKNQKNYLLFLHYVDTHAPFETPLNNISRKEFPEICKFLYSFENIFYRIPRRFLRKYLKPKTLLENFLLYKEYPNLKELNPVSFGPLLSPERLKDFYNKVWENEKLLNEYSKMKLVAAKYLDENIKIFFEKISDHVQDETIFFISADHGNNATLSPQYIEKNGVLNQISTHIPLSIFTFNEKLRNKFNIMGNIEEHTSHTDFYTTANYLFDINYNQNDFDENLLNFKNKERFIFSEINDKRYKYGQSILLSKNNNIELKTKPSGEYQKYKLYKKTEIIHSISEKDFITYQKYKQKYNDYFDNLRRNII